MEKALARFKFIAYLAGVVLILFTIEIILKYSGILEIPWFAQLHGIVYMVYVVIAFDMSRRAKLSLRDTFLVLIAGTIPVMSFIAESKIRRRVLNS
ncbi:membrane protein [Actinomycetes bacterium]|nr:membrane protein [Actinomycetes bacterium]